MRVVRWLTGRDRLFDPPLLATLTIHIDHRGDVHFYGPDRDDPAYNRLVVRALYQVADAWTVARVLREEVTDGIQARA